MKRTIYVDELKEALCELAEAELEAIKGRM
jgi:hypothetical protein